MNAPKGGAMCGPSMIGSTKGPGSVAICQVDATLGRTVAPRNRPADIRRLCMGCGGDGEPMQNANQRV